MKRLIFILIATLVLFGCSDSDDDTKGGNDSKLVGKWAYSKITTEVNTAYSEITDEITERLLNDTERQGGIEFTADGKYGYYDPLDKKWYWGTYDFRNNHLYVCFTDKEGTGCDLMLYQLQGNNLKVSYDETEWMKEEYPNARVTKAVQYIEYTK